MWTLLSCYMLERFLFSFLHAGLILARDECVICRKKKSNDVESGYESLQQCVTESGAQTFLNYADKSDVHKSDDDKSDDEYVKVKLAGLSMSDVTAKEFKYRRTCYQSLTRAAAASLSTTMDENNEKQNETTL